MNVLVTGGTGYLGRAIVQALDAAGHRLVLYGRTASGGGLPGTAVDGDIRDAARVRGAAAGCDAIVHTAAMVAVWSRRARDFDDINVGGLASVLEAAHALGTGRVVFTSSFLALPPAGADRPGAWNDYQRTKVEADRLAARAVDLGAPVIRLYPGVVYGPGSLTSGNLVTRQVADHLHGRLPGLVGADRIWSFAYVDDIAAAHVAAVERGRVGRRYLLGGENARQMRVFEIVRQLTGRALPRRIPAALAVLAAMMYEMRAGLFRVAPLATTGTVEILLRDWPLGCDLARDELGYQPRSLEDGVGRTLQWIIAGRDAAARTGTIGH